MADIYELNAKLFIELDSDNDLISKEFIFKEIDKLIKDSHFFTLGNIEIENKGFCHLPKPENHKEIPILKLKDFPDIQKQLYQQQIEKLYCSKQHKKSLLGKISQLFGIDTYYN